MNQLVQVEDVFVIVWRNILKNTIHLEESKSQVIKTNKNLNFYLYLTFRGNFLCYANPGFVIEEVYVLKEDTEQESEEDTGTVPGKLGTSWIVIC